MGKIFNALEKYQKERGADRQKNVQLTDSDWDALLNYDKKTGHLVKYDSKSGGFDGSSVEILKKNGTIQRLLAQNIIFPGGKLTSRGKKLVEIHKNQPPKREHQVNALLNATPKPAQRPVQELREPKADAHDRKSTSEIKGNENAEPYSVKKSGKPDSASIKEISHESLVCLNNPHSYEAEQFKILRTNIMYPLTGQPPRSILVTGANPGEGKSFVATNLAISVALNIDQYVLLIDCDLRKPVIHSRFGLNDQLGLSDYLTKGTPLTSLLVQTGIENLTVLPGGQPPPNPSELLSSDRMSKLLEEVTARYRDRLIIIDSPPPSLTAETGALARHVEGILLVVKAGHTRQDDLKFIVDILGKEKIIGSVLNYVDFYSGGYSSYRNFYKYGRYYKKK